MLSRLASRGSRIAARSLSARPLVALPSRREFHNSTDLKNAAPAAPTAAADMSPMDIINKYGSTTFLGCFAAIMVTKEMFILDAEFLLSCEVGLFALTGYVLTGDTLEKMSEEQDKKEVDTFNDANDFMLEMINQYKSVQMTSKNKPEVMQAYLAAYKASLIAQAEAQTIAPQHVARASVLAALEGIRSREEHAAAMEWQATVDEAVENVTAAFQAKGNEALLEECLNTAISNLGTDPSADSVDPVKRLFMDQFKDE